VDPKVLEKICPHREQIGSNRLMVALDLDLPLPLPIGEMKLRPDYPALIAELKRCEFRSLTAEVEREAAAKKPEVGNLKPEVEKRADKIGSGKLETSDRGESKGFVSEKVEAEILKTEGLKNC